MSCKCGSSRIASVGAYQIPEEYMEFSIKEDGKPKKGYFPCEIGNSDSIQFSFCADCGIIQGKFPLKLRAIDEE